MSGYMLDSNVLIDIAREPDGVVGTKFRTMAKGELAISVVVSGEIKYGMRKRPDSRSNPSMTYLLGSLRIDQIEPEVDGFYADIRFAVERAGKGLSANDMWIAAHAVARNAILVTGDVALRDAGIVGLRLQDWRIYSAAGERD